MIIHFSELSPGRVYHAMIQTIIPRPIAWVLTDSGGIYNLAPFSFFTGVSSEPPLLMISVGKKADGSLKDTWKNIEEREHFVVHIPHTEMGQLVSDSAKDLPHDQSEVDFLGLKTIAFDDFPLPRLESAKIAFACRRYKIDQIGDQALIFGLIETLYIEDESASMVEGRLKVDADKIAPLGRLGGSDFGLHGGKKTVPRK